MPDWMIEILKEQGLVGLLVGGLILIVIALGLVIKHLNARIIEMTEARTKEREAMVDMVSKATNAAEKQASATEERSKIIEELVEEIVKYSHNVERTIDKSATQFEFLKDKFQDQKLVIDAFAEAQRTATAIQTDMRNQIQQMITKVDQIQLNLPRGRSR